VRTTRSSSRERERLVRAAAAVQEASPPAEAQTTPDEVGLRAMACAGRAPGRRPAGTRASTSQALGSTHPFDNQGALNACCTPGNDRRMPRSTVVMPPSHGDGGVAIQQCVGWRFSCISRTGEIQVSSKVTSILLGCQASSIHRNHGRCYRLGPRLPDIALSGYPWSLEVVLSGVSSGDISRLSGSCHGHR